MNIFLLVTDWASKHNFLMQNINIVVRSVEEISAKTLNTEINLLNFHSIIEWKLTFVNKYTLLKYIITKYKTHNNRSNYND